MAGVSLACVFKEEKVEMKLNKEEGTEGMDPLTQKAVLVVP